MKIKKTKLFNSEILYLVNFPSCVTLNFFLKIKKIKMRVTQLGNFINHKISELSNSVSNLSKLSLNSKWARIKPKFEKNTF